MEGKPRWQPRYNCPGGDRRCSSCDCPVRITDRLAGLDLELKMGKGRLTICQISDIHCGNSRFIPELLDRTIIEVNRMNPRVVVVAGDLTDAEIGRAHV